MEREIELKILNIDLKELEKKLIEVGAKYLGEENQINIRINSTAHKIYKKEGYLRIRISDTNGKITKYLTFKENFSSLNVRDNIEHTITFDDEEELENILRLMGYDKFSRGEKFRKKYIYNDLKIDLDTWDEATYPYPYAEIEGPDEETIYKFIKLLEIPKEDISTLSIAELVKNLKK
ncbi:class IV adenylate cyclase [Peptoniphilus raoultii]|uniref:class IV adenylate cyclase n=1 Tax=Peptoniphilus raoultii TaxID=1776387 RepID=UPI0008DACAE0|nr:class IV adenylate cyclase [Peptoniphilus raoultii]